MVRRHNGTEKKNWNERFVDAVDEALKEVFKEEGIKVIYTFIEGNTQLTVKDLADKPEVFAKCFETLLSSSAKVIEEIILKKLYSKCGLKFKDKNDYKFSDYIKELKGK
ncbi:MAG: hypothetical protein WC325_09235 [Candidatus Bathyarchaeia archaeon]